MSDHDVAIAVTGVYKNFKLPHQRKNSIKSVFTGVFDRKNAAKSYEVQHALEDISFEIKKGEFFGIVGRNGSGKSTLLKIIAGIYQPTKGNIQVNGRLVPFIELGVGFNPELTGRENVYLNGALLGFSEKEVDGFYDEVVNFAELKRFMDQKLKNYSSGMQVRLAFAMAIRAQADILLIDEVLAVGDADFQRKCFNYFKKLKKNKQTVVFVSHDMQAIRQYCDRAVLIEDSKLINSGSAEKIALAYIRQFNRQENDTEAVDIPEEKRWGDGSVTIKIISATVNKDEVTISQMVHINKVLDGCIAGIRIKDSTGNHITGTNTKLEHQIIKNLEVGKKVKIVWRLPNIFSDGNYIIDVAVTHMDEITVCDWWDDAKQFTVQKNRTLPYAIDPGFDLSVE